MAADPRPFAGRHIATPLAIVGAAVVILVGFWWLLMSELHEVRRSVSEAAHTDTANLALAFEEHVVRTVRGIDTALLILRGSWLTDRKRFTDEVRIVQERFEPGTVLQIAVIGADGGLLYSSLQMPSSPVDLSDREHFRVHRETAADELFISKPVLGRVSGRSSIQLTRRIVGPDGGFGGVVVISLDPAHYAGFYTSIDLGRKGVITLLGVDGVIRARSLALPGGETSPPAALSWPFMRPGGPSEGSYVGRSPVDGIERIHSHRRLRDYPLVVVVGLAGEEVFAAYEQRRHNLVVLGIALSIALALGTAALARALRLQQKYRRFLVRDAERLEQANADLTARQERLRFTNDSLRVLNHIATLPHSAAGDKFAAALRLGARHFGLEIGIVSRIAGDDYTVLHCCTPPQGTLRPGDRFDLGQTYCALTLKANDVFAVGAMGASPYAGHPCYAAFRIESYIGVPIVVQGEVVGTVSFSSIKPYPREFDEGDLEFMRLLGQWAGSVLAEERSRNALRLLATTDPLTGVANRRVLLEALGQEISRAGRHGRPLSVAMVDIDHFKSINDTYGHSVGDQALVAVARTCQEALRGHDAFGRLGGEEFAALLTETDADAAQDACERLRKAIASIEILHAAQRVRVTASIGFAELRPNEDAESLLHRADQALYQAKALGRDRVIGAAGSSGGGSVAGQRAEVFRLFPPGRQER